jgi:Ca2+-binding EF-hand superfamily protein
MSRKFSRRDIKHLFYSYDKDGNGYLDFDEFSDLMKSCGGIDKSNYKFIFNLVDINRTGKIGYKEFKRVGKIICKYFIKDENEDADLSVFLFELIDVDKNTTIDRKEFHLMMSAIDPSISTQTVDQYFNHVDGDGNGTIDLKEFQTFCELIFSSNE